MPADITLTDLQRALDYLASIPGHDPESGDPLGLVMPEDTFPWPDADGNEQIAPLWQDAWHRFVWNPNLREEKSPKPLWETVQYAAAMAGALHDLDRICKQRITAGYGADDAEDEGFDRLRAAEPGADAALVRRITAGHLERDRLRARHADIKAWLLSVTDRAALESVNLHDPGYWAATWTP